VVLVPNDSLIQLIKRIAVSAVEASKPCNTFTGKVRDISPLEVSIGQKMVLDDEFITLTSTAREKIKKGSNVLMLRQAGGQKYVIIDTL
jgi:hypothetical protein